MQNFQVFSHSQTMGNPLIAVKNQATGDATLPTLKIQGKTNQVLVEEVIRKEDAMEAYEFGKPVIAPFLGFD